ncbi:MAG: ATP-dependent RecD-like DNA helicase [Chloroflexota bacterium]|nr:ATP-dependent RecD-like DNA helicase [Chloroflexota bacterium]
MDRVTFSNPETGFAVVHLKPADEDASRSFLAVGDFGTPRRGDCYEIGGRWRRDPKYGMQVQVSFARPETPQSLTAIERYLAGASIKGLGPHYAQALVNHFGTGTIQELRSGGKHLEEVKGIGPVRAQRIRESWANYEGMHNLMIKLQGVAELSPRQAQQVYRQYGHEAWDIISQDPYRLAQDVRGFGFTRCDQIGRALGIAHDASARIQGGVLHLLEEALSQGHLWCPAEQLAQEASELLGVPEERLSKEMEHLAETQQLVRRDVLNDLTAIFLPRVAHTEQRIAEAMAHLLSTPPGDLELPPQEAQAVLDTLEEKKLTAEQQEAILALLRGNRLVVLTGGPGTGKTTTIRSLIACLQNLRVSYALCATTGRASKQLAYATGHPAATVHRHLGIGMGRNEIKPINERVLIIDEASMIDLWLFYEIARRTRDSTRLFLIGDVDQLPPVGPGAILQDLISAGEKDGVPGIHVTRLTRIFRQEAGNRSMIVVNCHRIRAGRRPIHDVPKTSDYFEMHRDSPEEARRLAVDLVANRLPGFLDVPPIEVQVLAPMHRGAAGVRSLNLALQQALNPPAPIKAEIALPSQSAAAGQRVFRQGDKVRQTQNNYQKQVFNGDLGIIQHVYPDEGRLVVRFDEHDVVYERDELDQLVHAWAMTVHSAQGSQWPAVVILMLTNHYIMLERNILYTALSRAQRLAVLITQEKAVRIAVHQKRSTQRRTQLVARLLEALANP